jgi:hypothetical protein
MARKRRRRTGLLVLVAVVSLILGAAPLFLRPPATFLDGVVRGAALLGYLAVFLAALSSIFMREMVRFFGYPFITIHHVFSVAALILISLHPLAFVVKIGEPAAFLPRFDSLRVFLELGGRPAWYLIAAASLAAVLRRSLRQSWRSIHFLNYLGFLLATPHAILIGTDFQPLFMKILAAGMGLVVVVIFILKRRR